MLLRFGDDHLFKTLEIFSGLEGGGVWVFRGGLFLSDQFWWGLKEGVGGTPINLSFGPFVIKLSSEIISH